MSPCSVWLTTKLKAATTIGNSLRGYHLKEDLEELFGNMSTHFWLTYLFPHTHHRLLLAGGHNQYDRTQQKVKTVMFQRSAPQVYDSGCEVEEGVWLSMTYLYLFPFALLEVEIVLTLVFVFVFEVRLAAGERETEEGT